MDFFHAFKARWEKELPSAVACLARSLEQCLTFFHFPLEHWVSLRTTNMVERLNKEFKRRTKPMEIVAGAQWLQNLGLYLFKDGITLEGQPSR